MQIEPTAVHSVYTKALTVTTAYATEHFYENWYQKHNKDLENLWFIHFDIAYNIILTIRDNEVYINN